MSQNTQEIANALLIEDYPVTRGGVIKRVSLNSPKSLNALSGPMMTGLLANVPVWDADPKVLAIVLTGAGERAFCAGGDIRELYRAMEALPADTHDSVDTPSSERYPESRDLVSHAGLPYPGQAFFNLEYTLDMLLHNLSTPLLVWGHGYVMGGGMGLFQAADIRIVTPSSRLAMPEITIGLFPDVGASYFLAQVPDKLGLFLGLTAVPINATDALDLSMADALLPEAGLQELMVHMQTFDGGANAAVDYPASPANTRATFLQHVRTFIHNSPVDAPPESDLAPHRQQLCAAVVHEELASVLGAINALSGQSQWLDKAIKAMNHGSPTSLRLTFEQQCRGIDNWLDAFIEEYYLGVNSTRLGEFQEGIRALLIDKDQQPQWRYQTVDQVPKTWLAQFRQTQGIALADFMNGE